jgi:phosphate/sulfate permease
MGVVTAALLFVAYKGSLDSATKFIPTWVKIAVAIALGLGTMIGWKRIVVTVGAAPLSRDPKLRKQPHAK